jgi:DNA repair protein RecO (recombination protein O)
MTHKTKGIVLRTIKYGETSVVVSIFTELFGLQTYMVNGVRTTKRSSAKANHFQPGSILEMVVYHSDIKSMQRIKEFKWNYLYENILSDVTRNSIALYMIELLHKSLKQPEKNADLFYFFEAALMNLDTAGKTTVANFALYFSLQLTHFFGFRMNDDYDAVQNILDLQEGMFVTEQPTHPYFLDGEYASLTSQLLKVMQPYELDDFKLNRDTRRKLLSSYEDYYALHIQDFGKMKTLTVLHELLS